MSIQSSIYCYLFNLRTYAFDYKEALTNFCAFADEVVCATIKDEDGSRYLLHELAKDLPNLKIVETDIQLTNNRFDGLLKTAALKATTHPIKIIADGDERFLLSQKALWQHHYDQLMGISDIDGLYIPVLDLWGARDQIRAEVEIGQKFRIHKSTIVQRGVLPAAEMGGGRFDTSMSDSTEPLLANGGLGRFMSIVSRTNLMPMFSRTLAAFPYVVHEGYLSLENRAKINTDFWKPHWENRSGHEENVETNLARLQRVPTLAHGLPLV